MQDNKRVSHVRYTIRCHFVSRNLIKDKKDFISKLQFLPLPNICTLVTKFKHVTCLQKVKDCKGMQTQFFFHIKKRCSSIPIQFYCTTQCQILISIVLKQQTLFLNDSFEETIKFLTMFSFCQFLLLVVFIQDARVLF